MDSQGRQGVQKATIKFANGLDAAHAHRCAALPRRGNARCQGGGKDGVVDLVTRCRGGGGSIASALFKGVNRPTCSSMQIEPGIWNASLLGKVKFRRNNSAYLGIFIL